MYKTVKSKDNERRKTENLPLELKNKRARALEKKIKEYVKGLRNCEKTYPKRS